MSVIESLERMQLRDGLPEFKPGDTVRVYFRVIEGQRQRVQVFEGTVIKRQGSTSRETFTVRKQSFGVGVERTFPVHSPTIARIEVATLGDVRRAKLYYLRERHGKAAKIKERRVPRGKAAAEAVVEEVVEEDEILEDVEDTADTEVEAVDDVEVVDEVEPDGDEAEEEATDE